MNKDRYPQLDACPVCGVRASLPTVDGGRVTLVLSWRNRNDTVDSRCGLCDAHYVEGSLAYIGWLPEPEDVEAIVRDAYPTVEPGLEVFVAPEDRVHRLKFTRVPRTKVAM
jgi:hypothetical protein